MTNVYTETQPFVNEWPWEVTNVNLWDKLISFSSSLEMGNELLFCESLYEDSYTAFYT